MAPIQRLVEKQDQLNPTISNKNYTLEVHFFDFDKDIYGKTLKIEFLHWLRSEEKFDGLETLKKQLKKDMVDALEHIRLINA